MRGREVIAAVVEDRGITYAELGRRLDLSPISHSSSSLGSR